MSTKPYTLQQLFDSTQHGIELIEEFGFRWKYQGKSLSKRKRKIKVPIYEGCEPIDKDDPAIGSILLSVSQDSWHLRFMRNQKSVVHLTGTSAVTKAQALEAHQEVLESALYDKFVYLYQGCLSRADENPLELFIGAKLVEAFNQAYWEDYGDAPAELS